MTIQKSASWSSPEFAVEWAAHDTLVDFLSFPRAISSTIIESAGDRITTIADVGSGPGDFLQLFLTRFPDARGVWSDMSPTMESLARENLSKDQDRIQYVVADMQDLSPLPTNIDVLLTSRASHHLSGAKLAAFYREAWAKLVPGGWMVNLDHVGPQPQWVDRLRAARRTLVPVSVEQRAHVHDGPLPSIEEHMSALGAAGFTDTDMPWRAFYTVLFMAQK